LRESERKALSFEPDLRHERELFARAQPLPAPFRQQCHDIGANVVTGLGVARAWVSQPDR
jgi:hypothetical protein